MINHYDYMKWYFRTDVKFELIKQLMYREFALLVPAFLMKTSKISTRMLKCHSVQHFDFILDAIHIKTLQKYYNMYYSLAKYINGIPNQTMNFTKRDNEEWKNKTHYEEMIGYDFLLDIDENEHKNIDYVYQTTKEIKLLFDKCNVPYELRFSGMGFHFVISSMYMPKLSFFPDKKKNIYFLYKRIAERLNKKYSELIDTSIYDSRRICKLCYSLAVYIDDTYIYTPFNCNKQFKDFKLEDYNILNYNFSVRDRGLHTFNKYGNINKLLKDIQIYV